MGSTLNSIIVKNYTPIQDEALANAALYPGHLIELMSTGKVRKHATAGGRCERMIAIEDELQGNGITTVYAADSLVQFRIFRSGDVVLLRSKSGESISKGDKLVSAGDGTVQEANADSSATVIEQDIFAVAVEAIDYDSSSGEDIDDQLFKARII